MLTISLLPIAAAPHETAKALLLSFDIRYLHFFHLDILALPHQLDCSLDLVLSRILQQREK